MCSYLGTCLNDVMNMPTDLRLVGIWFISQERHRWCYSYAIRLKAGKYVVHISVLVMVCHGYVISIKTGRYWVHILVPQWYSG